MNLIEAKRRYPPIWTIYDHPRDYPNGFVARVWYGCIPDGIVATAQTLEEIRDAVYLLGASCVLPRASTDDLTIVESWI